MALKDLQKIGDDAMPNSVPLLRDPAGDSRGSRESA